MWRSYRCRSYRILIEIPFLNQIFTKNQKKTKKMINMAVKAYNVVSSELIKLIEENKTLPWQKPWESYNGMNIPSNFVTGNQYNGTNIFNLNFIRTIKGYMCNQWATYKQFKDKEIQVQKGEKSSKILAPIFKKRINEESGEEEEYLAYFRYFSVFNLEQTDYEIPPQEDKPEPEFTPIKQAEILVMKYTNKPKINHDEPRAYYSPMGDYINMPKKSSFKTPEGYYSTLFHELAHSTGHPTRMNRFEKNRSDFKGRGESYGYEELVAEFTSAYLMNDCNCFVQSEIVNTAAYLKSWLKSLKDNPDWLIKAANLACKIVKYMDKTNKK